MTFTFAGFVAEQVAHPRLPALDLSRAFNAKAFFGPGVGLLLHLFSPNRTMAADNGRRLEACRGCKDSGDTERLGFRQDYKGVRRATW